MRAQQRQQDPNVPHPSGFSLYPSGQVLLFSHFPNEETNVRRGQGFKSHTPHLQQSQNLNLGLPKAPGAQYQAPWRTGGDFSSLSPNWQTVTGQ
jgi:hypothetical protein